MRSAHLLSMVACHYSGRDGGSSKRRDTRCQGRCSRAAAVVGRFERSPASHLGLLRCPGLLVVHLQEVLQSCAAGDAEAGLALGAVRDVRGHDEAPPVAKPHEQHGLVEPLDHLALPGAEVECVRRGRLRVHVRVAVREVQLVHHRDGPASLHVRPLPLSIEAGRAGQHEVLQAGARCCVRRFVCEELLVLIYPLHLIRVLIPSPGSRHHWPPQAEGCACSGE
mmetsp:Transcript_44303/g.125441  ORF Transcript_44303/g.125441 Transcript_44303/m.125441 type:complete len:223 (-) Transcript_44303:102-770(-)